MGQSRPSGYADIGPGFDFPALQVALDAMRRRGELLAERQHVWQVFAGMTQPGPDGRLPTFLTWYASAEVFDGAPAAPQPMAPDDLTRVFTLSAAGAAANEKSTSPPLIIRTHYNLDAYRHIRDNALFRESQLRALAASDSTSASHATGQTIADFPRRSVVVKTAWWPIPQHGVVALPVWDAALNPPTASGNDYPSWARVVAVSTGDGAQSSPSLVDVDFMGTTFHSVRRVNSSALFRAFIDSHTAATLMRDAAAKRLAAMVLGRALRAGDSLALVAMHVASREIPEWIWGTFWWHDAPAAGPFAASRPATLAGPWRNYLMNVSFSSELPREPDGRPHIAFNPWFEARFPDQGAGGGAVSNCTSCHQRASFPAREPFKVTRGAAMAPAANSADAARLRTSSLWSIALEGR
jgi:hypothetical protein